MNEPRARHCAVYLHLPYCVKKCPYCDFNSYGIAAEGGSRTASLLEEQYTEALLLELQAYAASPRWTGRTLRSLFIGGGTPSLFSAESISRLVSEVMAHFPPEDGAELTMEANPGTVYELLDREKLAAINAAGINRLSFGAQSFSARKLTALGRIHRPEHIALAVENARAAGFSNINLDLMFGIADETTNEWQEDLQHALRLEPSHISAYNLTIEPGTDFARMMRKGELSLPPEERQAEMYRLAQDVLSDAGFEQYEISNYARPGKECRHNLEYWSGGEYLGLGAGAHSYCADAAGARFGSRWSNIPKPEHYIERILAHGAARQREEELDRETAELEFFFTRLRTSAGFTRESFRHRFGNDISAECTETLERLARDELLETGERTHLTQKGFLFADYVLK